MLPLLLACAEPEPAPVVESPTDDVRLELRVDVLPGRWPNQVDGGATGLAVIASDEVDPFALTALRLASWDFAVEVAVDTAPSARDVDGDGRDDAVWTVDLGSLLAGRSARVVVLADVDGGTATGWDVVIAADAPVAVLPAPTGPYVPGTVLTSSVGSRLDPLAATERDRLLPVQVWYPAEAPPGAQPGPPHLNYAEARTAAGWLGLDDDHFDRVAGHAIVGVPVIWVPPIEAWPVVVLTPGDGPVAAHSALAAELASHGFVVIGVNPPFSGIPAVLPDGTDATAPQREEPVDFDELVTIWTDDVGQLLDSADEWNDRDLRFEELLGTGRVAHVGVGLGGTASLDACRTQNRLLGCVDLDGTPLGSTADLPIGQSVLLVSTGDRFADEPDRDAVLAGTLTRSWSVELPDGGPDALWDLGHEGALLTGRVPDTGTADPADTFAAAMVFTVDFLDRTLRGGAGAVLDGGDTDDAVVRVYAPGPATTE